MKMVINCNPGNLGVLVNETDVLLAGYQFDSWLGKSGSEKVNDTQSSLCQNYLWGVFEQGIKLSLFELSCSVANSTNVWVCAIHVQWFWVLQLKFLLLFHISSHCKPHGSIHMKTSCCCLFSFFLSHHFCLYFPVLDPSFPSLDLSLFRGSLILGFRKWVN